VLTDLAVSTVFPVLQFWLTKRIIQAAGLAVHQEGFDGEGEVGRAKPQREISSLDWEEGVRGRRMVER